MKKLNDEVFLDNLPRTANQILNILWDRNRAMTAAELANAVNIEYGMHLEWKDVQKFARVLVNADYIDMKRRRFRAYYQPLGMDDLAEETLI